MSRRLVATLAGPLLASLALFGCGGSEEGVAESTDGTISVTLGSLSVAQAAPLVLAEEKGIFADNGIDITIEFIEPTAVVPGVLSGEFEFGYLAAPAVIAARANDVPIKSVATTSIVDGDPAEFPIQVMVPTGSDIDTPADLAGRKIAIDTLFQLPDLAMRGALLESGVDPNDVELVEIPYPQMGTALAEGQVDAAVLTEPFGTILRDSGAATDLLSVSVGQETGSPQSVLLASEEFIAENPDAVATFQTAVTAALEYAAAHEDEVRATLPTFTELDPELAEVIRFAPISGEDTPEGWQAWADLLTEVGVLDESVDAAEAYVES